MWRKPEGKRLLMGAKKRRGPGVSPPTDERGSKNHLSLHARPD